MGHGNNLYGPVIQSWLSSAVNVDNAATDAPQSNVLGFRCSVGCNNNNNNIAVVIIVFGFV